MRLPFSRPRRRTAAPAIRPPPPRWLPPSLERVEERGGPDAPSFMAVPPSGSSTLTIANTGPNVINQGPIDFAGYHLSLNASTNTPGGSLPGFGVLALQTANTFTVNNQGATAPLVIDVIG